MSAIAMTYLGIIGVLGLLSSFNLIPSCRRLTIHSELDPTFQLSINENNGLLTSIGTNGEWLVMTDGDNWESPIHQLRLIAGSYQSKMIGVKRCCDQMILMIDRIVIINHPNNNEIDMDW